jgi:hypothetical protein
MKSILNSWFAIDTNQFIFALRYSPEHLASEHLIFDKLVSLKVYIPLQVLKELQRNLDPTEMKGVIAALNQAKAIEWNYTPPNLENVKLWIQRGAKKGDAIIAADLDAANIPYLISANRHFLSEIPDLPFQVLSATTVLSYF